MRWVGEQRCEADENRAKVEGLEGGVIIIPAAAVKGFLPV
jgi:hypothetical protein